MRRPRMAWALAMALWLALAGCASMWAPRTIELSEARLQAWLARQFPIERRYFEVLEVAVAPPRLELRPETNRLAAEFEVRATDRLFKVAHRGIIALNCALRYEADDHTLRLTDVRIDRLEIDGALLKQQLDRVAVRLAEQMLNERAIYALRDKDIELLRGHGVRPGDIRVTRRGIEITLTPDAPR